MADLVTMMMEDQVREAEAAREAAARRYRLAPHGRRTDRFAELQRATAVALAAAAALAQAEGHQ